MLRKIYQSFRTWQATVNSSYGKDLSTPKARALSKLHTHLVDHAWIRKIWTNMYEIAPGVWRSNQPGPKRFKRLEQLGIRSIINLRGPSAFAVYLFEKESCAASNIPLYDNTIGAFHLSRAEDYLSLLQLFDTVERPVLFHCKSGADRAGLASAFYLIDQEGASVEHALKQLSLKHAHRKKSRTGVLDALLKTYGHANRENPISLRDWLKTDYDPQAISKAFTKSRKRPQK